MIHCFSYIAYPLSKNFRFRTRVICSDVKSEKRSENLVCISQDQEHWVGVGCRDRSIRDQAERISSGIAPRIPLRYDEFGSFKSSYANNEFIFFVSLLWKNDFIEAEATNRKLVVSVAYLPQLTIHKVICVYDFRSTEHLFWASLVPLEQCILYTSAANWHFFVKSVPLVRFVAGADTLIYFVQIRARYEALIDAIFCAIGW